MQCDCDAETYHFLEENGRRLDISSIAIGRESYNVTWMHQYGREDLQVSLGLSTRFATQM